jgi:molybdopterin converting factor small subunit
LHVLCERTPALQDYVPSLRVAINGAYVTLDEVVKAGDEVAVIPPVAGG